MQPERRKTALAFHAKDDLLEALGCCAVVHAVDETGRAAFGEHHTKKKLLV